jgi:hypothetical protein
MSTQVQINDVIPKTQITATGGQTVFTTNWTANAASDVVVYARTSTQEPDDLTQIVSNVNYNVAFIGGSEVVEVTFLVGRTAGDIITITRNTPADRLNLYTNTNFTPSMLNQDVGILTLVDQQAQLYNQNVAPHYNISATIDLGNQISGLGGDIYLPVLEANQFWYKNSSNTEIRAATLPTGGGQLPVSLPLLTYTATAYLTNEANLGALSTGFLFQTVAAGIATFSSVSDTGTGDVVRDTSPTISSPNLEEARVINVSATITDYTELQSDATGTKIATFPDETGTVQFQKSSPTVQVLTVGSGTYTTPAGVKYIVVEIVGSGAGGQGSITGAATSTGNASTFGALLTANGGNAAIGGTTTINAPAIGFGVNGGDGGEKYAQNTATFSLTFPGGAGGSSYFGGVGAYGSGGNGGGYTGVGTAETGAGGGAGGYIKAIINNPSASYAYVVGAKGLGTATAGTPPADKNGSDGSDGICIVTEYYQ